MNVSTYGKKITTTDPLEFNPIQEGSPTYPIKEGVCLLNIFNDAAESATVVVSLKMKDINYKRKKFTLASEESEEMRIPALELKDSIIIEVIDTGASEIKLDITYTLVGV